jgi:hypothetical protein
MDQERRILVASEAGIAIRSFGDISDAIGACLGADGLVLAESDLAPEFFELRTGLLGELVQKFVNYRIRAAIVVPDPKAHGDRFAELAYEHATHDQVRFVRSMDEATAWLGA